MNLDSMFISWWVIIIIFIIIVASLRRVEKQETMIKELEAKIEELESNTDRDASI